MENLATENLTLDALRMLAQQQTRPSISIYLPTHRAGQETYQDPIRYKNLLREAEMRLSDGGMKPREIDDLLRPAQALLNETYFWQHQLEGLAVFIAPDDFHIYRLPIHFDELLIIAQSYYVKPILPLFTHNGHYYILAFSQSDARLFEATRYSIGQLDLPEGTPTSLEEALEHDDPEKELQFHSGTSPSTADGGIRASMFHGHGGGDEDHKIRVERYLNLLDHGLKPLYRESRTPLVLAAVDYLLPMYRKVSEYAHIVDEGITGSPEHLRAEELQEQAWPLVEPLFRAQTDSLIEQYHQLAAHNRATDRVNEVVAAAFYGRVDSLLLAVDAQVWGAFDPHTGQVTHSSDAQTDEDDLALLDFAAMQTLQNGGTVYALPSDEMPTDSPALAILRY